MSTVEMTGQQESEAVSALRGARLVCGPADFLNTPQQAHVVIRPEIGFAAADWEQRLRSHHTIEFDLHTTDVDLSKKLGHGDVRNLALCLPALMGRLHKAGAEKPKLRFRLFPSAENLMELVSYTVSQGASELEIELPAGVSLQDQIAVAVLAAKHCVKLEFRGRANDLQILDTRPMSDPRTGGGQGLRDAIGTITVHYDFSVSFWLKAAPHTAVQMLFHFGTFADGKWVGPTIEITQAPDGVIKALLSADGHDAPAELSSPAAMDVWTLITMTRREEKLWLYRDGFVVDATRYDPAALPRTERKACVGASAAPFHSHVCKGVIADPIYMPAALPGPEIAARAAVGPAKR
jgi:hypothetical protein